MDWLRPGGREGDRCAQDSDKTTEQAKPHDDTPSRATVDLGDLSKRGLQVSTVPACSFPGFASWSTTDGDPSPLPIFSRSPPNAQSELTFCVVCSLLCLLTLFGQPGKFQWPSVSLCGQGFKSQPLSQAPSWPLGWLPIPGSAGTGGDGLRAVCPGLSDQQGPGKKVTL